MIRFLAPIALFFALAPVGAMAQDAGDPYAACAALTDDTARLQCFDTAYAAARTTIAETARLAAEQARRDEERREVEFGLDYSQRDQRRAEEAAAGGAASADVERIAAAEAEEASFGITANVTEVSFNSRRKAVVLLENGMLWRETSGSSLRVRPRDDWVASITRHWSGAYEMRFEGRSGYLRVERIR